MNRIKILLIFLTDRNTTLQSQYMICTMPGEAINFVGSMAKEQPAHKFWALNL